MATGFELHSGMKWHLNRWGGRHGSSVTSAISIGRILRKEEARAIVPDGSICNSACVLILGGAVTRSFERIGIHRPYLETSIGNVSNERIAQVYQTMLQEVRAY